MKTNQPSKLRRLMRVVSPTNTAARTEAAKPTPSVHFTSELTRPPYRKSRLTSQSSAATTAQPTASAAAPG